MTQTSPSAAASPSIKAPPLGAPLSTLFEIVAGSTLLFGGDDGVRPRT